ncbi:right-handed parallel beta-helix repeat-containing protein [Scytonema tolypothrichoides VB-61278]|nr:right-handed parallel beta-helix repeat-containing protein [Scytonema tolypothrichoides VB-61278]
MKNHKLKRFLFPRQNGTTFPAWQIFGSLMLIFFSIGSQTQPGLASLTSNLFTKLSSFVMVSPNSEQNNFANQRRTLYVSPDGKGNACTSTAPCTLTSAQQYVRSINTSMKTDITVILKNGTYYLSDTFTLGTQDSGFNGHSIIFRAQTPGKVELSGGKVITGWQTQDGKVFQTAVDNQDFRRLFINGVPAIRARQPNTGSYFRVVNWDIPNKRVEVKPSEINRWKKLSEAEMIVFRHWTINRFKVEDFTINGNIASVALQNPGRDLAFMVNTQFLEPELSYYFENAYEFLDDKGEFYLDKEAHTLYYIARPGEDMSRTTVIAPRLDHIVKIAGTAEKPVQNIVFQGIVFQDANWTGPSQKGFIGGQAGTEVSTKHVWGDTTMIAGVELSYTQNVSFEKCTFRNMSASGVNASTDVENLSIRDSHFENLGGQGIVMDTLLHSEPATATIRNVLINNNTLTALGQDYPNSVGIFAGFVENMTIENNKLWNLPYTGISIGWGWTKDIHKLKRNIIRNNEIYNVMNTLDDGAGIYTLSNQYNTLISNNYIHHLVRSPWAAGYPISGVYLDQASGGITVTGNKIDNVVTPIYTNSVQNNNIIEGNWPNAVTDNKS